MVLENPSREAVADLLRSHEITLTHQRIEIAMALFARRQHLSADEVLTLVNARHAEVSKATVYNTLKLYVEKGLIAEVIVDPNRVYFDSETAPHYHLYDADSGQLTDIPASGVEICGLPQLPPGKVTERIDIVVRARSAR